MLVAQDFYDLTTMEIHDSEEVWDLASRGQDSVTEFPANVFPTSEANVNNSDNVFVQFEIDAVRRTSRKEKWRAPSLVYS